MRVMKIDRMIQGIQCTKVFNTPRGTVATLIRHIDLFRRPIIFQRGRFKSGIGGSNSCFRFKFRFGQSLLVSSNQQERLHDDGAQQRCPCATDNMGPFVNPISCK